MNRQAGRPAAGASPWGKRSAGEGSPPEDASFVAPWRTKDALAMTSSDSSESKQIKVLVRCRPILQHEAEHSTESISVDKDAGTIRLNTRQGNTKEFSFDNVFDGSSTQESVYEKGEFSRTVDAVLKGFNSTVFAYGQTGTGKTFTMEGKSDVARTKDGRAPRTRPAARSASSRGSSTSSFTSQSRGTGTRPSSLAPSFRSTWSSRTTSCRPTWGD